MVAAGCGAALVVPGAKVLPGRAVEAVAGGLGLAAGVFSVPVLVGDETTADVGLKPAVMMPFASSAANRS